MSLSDEYHSEWPRRQTVRPLSDEADDCHDVSIAIGGAVVMH